jgi:hypothetical protein
MLNYSSCEHCRRFNHLKNTKITFEGAKALEVDTVLAV